MCEGKLLGQKFRYFVKPILHAGGAINSKHLAVDPLAVLRSKEADNTGNVNGETDTMQR